MFYTCKILEEKLTLISLSTIWFHGSPSKRLNQWHILISLNALFTVLINKEDIIKRKRKKEEGQNLARTKKLS